MLGVVLRTLGAVAGEIGAWVDDVLPLRGPRSAFRRWRRTRPFWGGVLVAAGGAAILLVPLAPLPVMIHVGMAAVSGVAIGAILVAAGLFFWFAPQQRMFVAVVAAVCSLTSFVTSNLGGLGIGMLLGLLGSSMAFGWRPHVAGSGQASAEGRRRTERTRARAARFDPLRRELVMLLPAAGLVSGIVLPWPFPPLPTLPPLPTIPTLPTPAPGATPSAAPSAAPAPTLSATPGATPGPTTSPAPSLTAPPRARSVETEGTRYGPNVPEVAADTLRATGFTFRGTTTLPSVDGPIPVLAFHADRLVADDYRITTRDPGEKLTLTVDLDIDDVAIYATRLSGTVTVPYLDIPLIPITFTPDLIPTWLRLNLWLPVFTGRDVTAGQVGIEARTVRAANLRADVTRADD